MKLIVSVITFAFIMRLTPRCTDEQKRRPEIVHIHPFEMTIWNSDYSNAYSLRYQLSEKKLTITFQGELEVERDSIVFIRDINNDVALRSVSQLDFARLQELYANDCVQDGSQITFISKKNGTSKTVHLSNYYQHDIAEVIHYINEIVPNEYQIIYDSAKLTRDFYECK